MQTVLKVTKQTDQYEDFVYKVMNFGDVVFYLAGESEGEIASGEIFLCPAVKLSDDLWTHGLLIVTNLTTTHEMAICRSQFEPAVDFDRRLVVDGRIILHAGKAEMIGK